MNGMCILQEAKLAALASKRWEHQLKEQSVQTEASRDLMIWAHLCSVADLGARGNLQPYHPEGNDLGNSWEQRECSWPREP